jgi:hypothetical protein
VGAVRRHAVPASRLRLSSCRRCIPKSSGRQKSLSISPRADRPIVPRERVMSRVPRITDWLERERSRHLTRIVAEHQCPVWPGNPDDKTVARIWRSCMSPLKVLHCCVSSGTVWGLRWRDFAACLLRRARLVHPSRGLPCGGNAAYQGGSRLPVFQLDGGGGDQERGADGGGGERGGGSRRVLSCRAGRRGR